MTRTQQGELGAAFRSSMRYRLAWFVPGVGVIAEVVGGAYGEDALVAADLQRPFQEAAALIVQKIFVPAAFYEFGDDDHNSPLRMLFRQIQNVLKNGQDDETVGRRQYQQFRGTPGRFGKCCFDPALPRCTQE